MEQWLVENGSYISDKIQISTLPNRGNSVVCTSAIGRGQTLVSIKKRLLLNKRTLPSSCSTLSVHQGLALYITLNRTNPESEWAPFLKELPTDFADVPLTAYIENNSHLTNNWPPEIASHVTSQASKFDADYTACLTIHSSLKKSEFLKSWLAVNSRCLYMPGVEENTTMAPYIDFFNHCVGEQDSVDVSYTAADMVVRAKRDYSPGEELLLRYGPHDNVFLLCEYGFTLENNPWDYIDVSSEILDMLDSSKREFLKSRGYLMEYTINRDGPSFRTLVALATVNSSDLKSIDAIINGVVEPPTNVSILQGLIDKRKSQYKQYPSFSIHKFSIGT